MRQHLNTLFVTLDDAYLAKQGEAVLVRVAKQTKLRLPIHTLGGIVCFGRIGISPALMHLCGERGVAISLLSGTGRFLAKIDGFTSGNVLLRREQYRRADDLPAACGVARTMVAAKIANARAVLMRTLRDYPANPAASAIERTIYQLAGSARNALASTDLDALRGVEGDASRIYFDVFDHAITQQKQSFAFRTRSRRPPLDPVNALLSFLYAMLAHDCRAACEAVGLDPAVGFLHRDRPGRPGLALDLMEEFRPLIADRLALSMINRRQVDPQGFTTSESGAVIMKDATRKAVLIAYQKRKQEEIIHPSIGDPTTVGLLPHLQARLRGDLDAYPAFIVEVKGGPDAGAGHLRRFDAHARGSKAADPYRQGLPGLRPARAEQRLRMRARPRPMGHAPPPFARTGPP